MSVKYLKISVSIHGLEISEETATIFLVEWIRTETKTGLMGNNKNLFGFRNECESDIEVEVEESAGRYERYGNKET